MVREVRILSDARTYWFYRNKKPPSDDAIFENLSRVVIQGGLSWDIIQRKWPNFQIAFANFEIEKVANFTEEDIVLLLENEGIIRNKIKIEAVIENAKEFSQIIQEHHSFSKYMNSIGKEKNYALIIKDLIKRMRRLGKKSCYIFLYSIGEEIEWDIE